MMTKCTNCGSQYDDSNGHICGPQRIIRNQDFTGNRIIIPEEVNVQRKESVKIILDDNK